MQGNTGGKQHMEEAFWAELRCPLCHTGFRQAGGSLRCESGHCFDIAAKGYVNLLPNQKPTKYTRVFFENRMAMFAAGLYREVAEAVAAELRKRTLPASGLRVLDAGCGEGSYARLLQAAFPRAQVYALDLEKEAIRLAVRGASGIRAMVGDLANIPLRSGSVDMLCNIFSPANYGEFSRVLRKNGGVIKIIPGPRHMAQLRALLGKTPEESGEVEALFVKQCILERRVLCGGTYPLGEEQRVQLLAMTPLLFDLPEEARELSALREITIEGVLLAGRPRRGNE